jgi:hypothetical protein
MKGKKILVCAAIPLFSAMIAYSALTGLNKLTNDRSYKASKETVYIQRQNESSLLKHNSECEKKESIWDDISDFKDYMLEPVSENEHYIPLTEGGYPRCVGMIMPFIVCGVPPLYLYWRFIKKDSEK